ncbi:hypothetical protein ACFLXX_01370 [Chloroflexota bacterium]
MGWKERFLFLILEGTAVLRIRMCLIGETPGEGVNNYFIALSEGKCVLRKLVMRPDADPQVTDLVTPSVQIKPNTWHNAAFTCKGKALSLDLDGVKVLEYVDESDPVLSGSVVIASFPDSHVLFDDIVIEEYTK